MGKIFKNVTILLKQNNEEIRRRLCEAGLTVCQCAKIFNADWLYYHPYYTASVHGVGYPYEGMSKEQTLAMFMHENQPLIECNDVDEFIKTIRQYQDES